MARYLWDIHVETSGRQLKMTLIVSRRVLFWDNGKAGVGAAMVANPRKWD